MKRASISSPSHVGTHDPQALLKARGLKVTEGRVAVLTALMRVHEPVSIEALAQLVPTVNTVTLYRMLERFVQEGLVYQADFRNGKAYFEYQPHHHHHITCTSCGRMEAVDACVAETQKKALAHAEHFNAIESHVLEFFGRCTSCTQRVSRSRG